MPWPPMTPPPSPEDRAATGWPQSPSPVGGNLVCLMELPTCEAKKRKEPVDLNTTRSSSLRKKRRLCGGVSLCSNVQQGTLNLQEVKLPKTIAGRKSRGLENPMNLGQGQFEEIQRQTGRMSGGLQQKEKCSKSHTQYGFSIIGLSRPLLLTTFNRFRWSELQWCSGVRLELVNRAELGMKPDLELILKIHAPNFGAGIKVKIS